MLLIFLIAPLLHLAYNRPVVGRQKNKMSLVRSPAPNLASIPEKHPVFWKKNLAIPIKNRTRSVPNLQLASQEPQRNKESAQTVNKTTNDTSVVKSNSTTTNAQKSEKPPQTNSSGKELNLTNNGNLSHNNEKSQKAGLSANDILANKLKMDQVSQLGGEQNKSVTINDGSRTSNSFIKSFQSPMITKIPSQNSSAFQGQFRFQDISNALTSSNLSNISKGVISPSTSFTQIGQFAPASSAHRFPVGIM
jgi:hypothetical protein